jgi:hypothetical protein
MDRQEPVIRFRCTSTLIAQIEHEANRRHLKVHDIARVALAEGLRSLFGDEDAPALLSEPSPLPVPEPEPPAVEERKLTTDEVAEAARLRAERASHWTWTRLGDRYGVAPTAVKLALMQAEKAR